jgi:hypothetical protein
MVGRIWNCEVDHEDEYKPKYSRLLDGKNGQRKQKKHMNEGSATKSVPD